MLGTRLPCGLRACMHVAVRCLALRCSPLRAPAPYRASGRALQAMAGPAAGGRSPVVLITGPTAVGKTELSIRLAQALDGEIISADSVQVYRTLDVGSDKAGPAVVLTRLGDQGVWRNPRRGEPRCMRRLAPVPRPAMHPGLTTASLPWVTADLCACPAGHSAPSAGCDGAQRRVFCRHVS